MDDYRQFTKTLGEVHEKVNTVALAVASIKGTGSGWASAVSMMIAGGALIITLIRR